MAVPTGNWNQSCTWIVYALRRTLLSPCRDGFTSSHGPAVNGPSTGRQWAGSEPAARIGHFISVMI